MKICFYGFGTYRYILLELIELFGKELDWSIILPTFHNKEKFEFILRKEKVCYLYENFNHIFEQIDFKDRRKLKNYGGYFYEDLMSDKVALKKKNSFYQEKHGLAVYFIYKNFLENEKPEFVFFPHMETHEARILYSISKELGIKTIVYAHARNYGVSYYSKKYWQKLSDNIQINKDDLKIGKEFVDSFKKNPSKDIPDIGFDFSMKDIYKKVNKYKSSAIKSIINNLKYRFSIEKYYHGGDTFLQKFRVRFIKYTEKLYYKPKFNYIREKYFKKISVDELKNYNYIYFPLQVTPESSTNNFEPYYVDQIRAIDLLRKNMPNDYIIVLKDHPAYFGRRSFEFYNKITKLPGTILVDYSLNSLDLIKYSKLVSSITGTANLEALLLGKKSLIFGKCFFQDYVYKYDLYWNFNRDLSNILNNNEELYEKAIMLSARVLKIGKKFVLFDPLDLYFRKKNVTFARENLEIAYKSLKSFMENYDQF